MLIIVPRSGLSASTPEGMATYDPISGGAERWAITRNWRQNGRHSSLCLEVRGFKNGGHLQGNI